ncbi:hypothetical protein GCM10023171_28230 [Microbacterium panaciterrae]|uniref:MASE1 domain-containing protein n=2 Tax=Microbacterium panaciterrae TaxID=985759 RepID=A0ABP8PMP3_9MICO
MLTQPLVAAVVDPPQYQMPLSNSVPPLQLVVPVTLSVKLMLALIAAIQIGRVGVVPRPWNWTPLWVLCAVAIMTAVPMSPFWTPLMGSGANIAPLMVVFDAFGLARQAAVAFLGIVAIVLGSRSGTGSVPVYSSAAP